MGIALTIGIMFLIFGIVAGLKANKQDALAARNNEDAY